MALTVALILVVMVAYLICRRREKARGQNSLKENYSNYTLTTQQDQFDEQNEGKNIKEVVKSSAVDDVFYKIKMIKSEIGCENSYPENEETEKPMIEREWIKKLTLEDLDDEEVRRGLGEWII